MEAAAENQVGESIELLFRRQAGQMVSVLCRIFGFEKLDLIEDAVQDSLVSAMKKWPFAEIPENPGAWLIASAKNRVIDRLRYDRRFGDATDEDGWARFPAADTNETTYFKNEIADDELRMIFACCHPAISPDSQVALTLKTVGGFSVAEIARAYLAEENSVAKLLTRAKHKLRDGKVSLEIPSQADLTPRLGAVLKVLYLMFNEGYTASDGDHLIRTDLCFEAIRLCEFLASHPATASPKTHALAALFLFQAARLDTRVDEAGELVLLAEQDRTSWNKGLIGRALEHFRLSARGDELSEYHLEAEIASLHATAEKYESTNWERILNCYEDLSSRRYSPVAELNRIVALSEVRGKAIALEELDRLADARGLSEYNLFHVTKAHFLSELGDAAEAEVAYNRAIQLTRNVSIRRFLLKNLESLRKNRPAVV